MRTAPSMSEPDARLFKSLRLYCQLTAIAVMVLGCMVLYGWAFHIEILKTVLPGLVPMKANSATSMVCSGISLWLLLSDESRVLRHRIARLLAIVPTLFGAATLSEYIFGVNLRIDQLLFRDILRARAT